MTDVKDVPYGYELIMDVHNADPSKFTRRDIKAFFKELCDLIDMQREDLHFWDYEGDPEEYEKAPVHLRGTSAVQFIKTSSIVLHTLDDLKKVFIDVFSCKEFDAAEVKRLTESWFKGQIVNCQEIERI